MSQKKTGKVSSKAASRASDKGKGTTTPAPARRTRSELSEDELSAVAGGVEAVTHEIVSPRDAASGLPTGKRMHKPFTID